MRVGIDARILAHPRSGIAVYVINLIDQFLNFNDLEIVLFGDRPINEEYRNITGKVESVIFGQDRRKYWSQFYLPLQLKKYKIDVYHAVWNNAVPIFTGIPSILTVHDIIPLVVSGYFKNIRRRYKYIFFMHSALSKAKAIITDAENIKADLARYFHVPPGKVTKVSLGISQDSRLEDSPEKKSKVLQKFNINSDYMVNIGSFDKRRNADTLIKAFAAAMNGANFNCQLVLIGGYDNFLGEINRFNQLIERLNLKEKVIFTNYVTQEEKNLLISGAKVMVHLSLYEGFCFPVLEAMQLGVPVIASNTGSVPEITADAAMLVDPRDFTQAAGAIRRLLQDKNLTETFIRKGFNRVKDFSWEQTAIQTRKVYEKIS